MSECIVITSGKGGVGKTTSTANLGVALALMGKKVAVVDADIGLRNLDVILGLENRIVYDLVHVIEGECRLKQALIKDKRVENLYLLPAAQTRDKNAVSPSDAVINLSLQEQTRKVLSTLTPREEKVLRMRFGIGEKSDHTLEEVGQDFEVTRERIRQIEAKALRKLRHPSRSKRLRAFVET